MTKNLYYITSRKNIDMSSKSIVKKYGILP